ncbi:amidohydrolase [Paenibacillus sp. GCM10012307]|uniref:Amidohydrolase n=1 Tax=Paenibacillus roseus TaxID=2798579 RepID=A0A934JAQ5_9BACL|nr:amidohydrolase [Paenibacillus roseus]MBJ6363726.1 amidohydrolase [Paenibacillus roseus]
MGNAELKAASLELEPRLVDIRRELHQHPELSNEEYETTAAIRRWLSEAGIRIAPYSLRTGLVAEVGSEETDGPIIALRADIDALPVQEATGLPFVSVYEGKMHACGHDFHTASLLGAALLLKEREAELQGKVRLIFQPAEEKATGAQQVIRSGALEGVQAVFGLHNKPDLPVGTVGIKSGPLMAAADGFKIQVDGIGTHAAVPDAGIDPIVAAAHIVTALQSVVSRNVSPLDSAVVSVTKIHSGNSWNVIPDKAVMEGTLRTFDERVRKRVRERFAQVIDGVASALDTTAQLNWIQGPPPVLNDSLLANLGKQAASSAGLEVVEPVPSSAGEDFAFYQQQAPGLFVFMGTSGTQEWHHPGFTLNEDALPYSARFLAQLALDALKSEELLRKGETVVV